MRLLWSEAYELDDSASSTNLSSPQTSVGLITPPTTPAHLQQSISKDGAADTRAEPFGFNRASTQAANVPWTTGGSLLPVNSIATLNPLRKWTRARRYSILVTDGDRGSAIQNVCGHWIQYHVSPYGTADHLYDRHSKYGLWSGGRVVPLVVPQGRRKHQVYDGAPPSPASKTEMNNSAKKITYADNCQALVYQYPLTRATKLPYMTSLEQHEWHQSRRQRRTEKVEFHYQYALALAVNERLEQDPTDGLIALSLSSFQGDTTHNVPVTPYQSFFDAVCAHLTVSSDRRIGAGAVMYIDLRFIPHGTPLAQKELYQSCYAFGGWPFASVPDWSKEIPVVPNHLSGGRDSEYERCVVALVGMEIRTTTRDPKNRTKTRTSGNLLSNESAAATQSHPVFRLKGIFGGQGKKDERAKRGGSSTQKGQELQEDEEPEPVHVLLDTGSSISFLPEQAIRAIARHFGGTLRSGGSPQSTYTIPFNTPGVGTTPDSDRTLVVLRFKGQGSQLVEVQVPALYFLYAPSPDGSGSLESLIFPRPDAAGIPHVLGVNFFHSAWVAMAKPAMRPPFVSIAPKSLSHAELQRFQLPPQESIFGR
ncbi:hypothetical protein NUW54_g7219 [Trametes sanguinea]|uniref:Uncharacterized protein n=1 Tax=Trametes sanguinea TaxID=158606 RepID=A0ACC1PMZ9_9APHY|nr:hypothetical protein NUW54_g7219 [Trametes sanguinea]